MEQEEALAQQVAIIGMAGRFPRAETLEQFWQNLAEGVEAISVFSEQELLAVGLDTSLVCDPHYVKAQAIVEHIDLFDAAFFGYSPRDAEVIDPQQRIFLEEAWHALEHAGYNPRTFTGRIGVFAGTSMSSYLWHNLLANREYAQRGDMLSLILGNDKDYLPTRVSYKLNLRGPSVTVQTACSTSLVAIHLACQSVLNGECEMALAGGVSISAQQKAGYLYQEGGITSPDGHCRAFDANAQGTVSGNGVGIVVLKRLTEALADGDFIHAVIRGSAINNDGSLKVGYTAPSIAGQAEVIAEALAMADVDPRQVTYIEGHGTGTPLGDPIEIAALTQVYQATTDDRAFCAIGSVKTNIGHLDAAAGVAGIIKTILALQHRQIPPSLHFERPNPNSALANSPFYVNTRLSAWSGDETPRLAGVSSFGMGGTNAHVVLEEAPTRKASGNSRDWQLLLLSARTETALEAATTRLAAYLKQNSDLSLADIAYTLQVGREAFQHRRALVCRDLSDAMMALSMQERGRLLTQVAASEERPIAFLFPGQGTQYPMMAWDLYQHEPVFRTQVDRCAELLKPHVGLDVRKILYPGPEREDDPNSQRLHQTAFTQPGLFVIEYALATLWLSWGVKPQALLGHSIGEYVAACIAGVFSLEEALALVAARGRLIQQLPGGSLLSVALSEAALRSQLDPTLSLAAINGPTFCVVAGPPEAITALQVQLSAQEITCRLLQTSHAFHSAMMEPILATFAALFAKISLQAPTIPYLSNVTGTWITAREATDPQYWVQHLRQTVRFADNVAELLKEPQYIMLEVGPGRTLSGLVRQQTQTVANPLVLTSLNHARGGQNDQAFLLDTLAKLWLHGGQIDWAAFSAHEHRQRLPLPTYPFERQRYWVERTPQSASHLPAEFAISPATTQLAEKEETDIDKLPSLYARPALPSTYEAPRTEIERSIAVIWQELLGIEQIGVYDDFFDLGGHSVLSTQCIARLRETFPVEFPLSSLFDYPTIAQFAMFTEELLLAHIEQLSEEEIQHLL